MTQTLAPLNTEGQPPMPSAFGYDLAQDRVYVTPPFAGIMRFVVGMGTENTNLAMPDVNSQGCLYLNEDTVIAAMAGLLTLKEAVAGASRKPANPSKAEEPYPYGLWSDQLEEVLVQAAVLRMHTTLPEAARKRLETSPLTVVPSSRAQ